MKTKMFLFCVLFSTLGISVSCNDKNGSLAVEEFETYVIRPYSNPFYGFGYNQYQSDFNPDFSENFVWTEERYQMMEERIKAIRPGLVRMPVLREWFNPSFKAGEYDWDTPEMQAHYKFMDLYKEMGVKVLDGWWHVTTYETDKDGFKDLGNVEVFVDYIDYMLNVKGYDNIEFFQPSNEPYGTYTVFEDWSKFMKEADKQLKAIGIKDKLCGPDSWDDWVGKAAEQNQELVSYNFHFYFDGTAKSNDNLGLYDALMGQMDQVTKWDKSNKPVVCAECGAINTSWLDYPAGKPDDGVAIYSWDYIYAVYMADFAIQAMRAGLTSCLSWGLHGFNIGKDGGMWNNSEMYGGIRLRPLYYVWSNMCRLFPDGAVPLDMRQCSGDIKVGGAAIGGAGDYSFVISSKAGYDDEVVIKLPKGNKGKYYVYTFTEKSQGDGVQLSLPYIQVNEKERMIVKIPSESVVFVTTLTPIE